MAILNITFNGLSADYPLELDTQLTYVKQSVGKNKAEALKTQLLNFHGLKAESFGVWLTADNVTQLCGAADLIVDCFDNLWPTCAKGPRRC